jgi:hypothetical protein
LDSHWALLKRYRKSACKCPNQFERLCPILKGHFEAAGKCQIPDLSLLEKRQNCPVAVGKTVAISNYFL